MLKKEHLNLLNQQIEMESYAANLYLSMSLWCRHKGLEGCGTFFAQQAEQEELHRKKLIQYILETGGLPILGSISAPPSQYDSIKSLFQQTLAHEKEITQRVNHLVDTFLQDKDFSTFNFLQWYISEQHEEEHKLTLILDKIDMIGEDKRGLFWLDKEIGKVDVSEK